MSTDPNVPSTDPNPQQSFSEVSAKLMLSRSRCTRNPFIRTLRLVSVVTLLVSGSSISGCSTIRQSLPAIDQLLPVKPTVNSPQPTPLATQSVSTAEMEEQVFQQINAVRQQQNLRPLRQNDKLAEVARSYSRRMAEQNFFSHTSPSGDSAAERVQAKGIFYFMLGENLFTSTNVAKPVPAAVEGWMNSEGHRQNILRSEYAETGIGVWQKGNTYYFTQLFMRGL